MTYILYEYLDGAIYKPFHHAICESRMQLQYKVSIDANTHGGNTVHRHTSDPQVLATSAGYVCFESLMIIRRFSSVSKPLLDSTKPSDTSHSFPHTHMYILKCICMYLHMLQVFSYIFVLCDGFFGHNPHLNLVAVSVEPVQLLALLQSVVASGG